MSGRHLSDAGQSFYVTYANRGERTYADAVWNRIMHNAYIIKPEGGSMRKGEVLPGRVRSDTIHPFYFL